MGSGEGRGVGRGVGFAEGSGVGAGEGPGVGSSDGAGVGSGVGRRSARASPARRTCSWWRSGAVLDEEGCPTCRGLRMKSAGGARH